MKKTPVLDTFDTRTLSLARFRNAPPPPARALSRNQSFDGSGGVFCVMERLDPQQKQLPEFTRPRRCEFADAETEAQGRLAGAPR